MKNRTRSTREVVFRALQNTDPESRAFRPIQQLGTVVLTGEERRANFRDLVDSGMDVAQAWEAAKGE